MDISKNNTHDTILRRSLYFLPYFDLLFFIEIFYLMSLLFILYGKVIAVTIGLVLIIGLMYIIFSTYFFSEKGRVAQLYWFDGHIALSFSYIVLFGLRDHTRYTAFDWSVLVMRSLMLLVECYYVYFLTSKRVRTIFRSS